MPDQMLTYNRSIHRQLLKRTWHPT